ncbi:MAG: STAS domain-containing protein, partial [Polyangiaceae bacterium]|nr:STAS domain-containing protein [Polyangiaceae bacterium]
MTDLAALLRDHFNTIVGDIGDYLINLPGNRYGALPREERDKRVGAGVLTLIQDVAENKKPPGAFSAFFAERTPTRVRQGFDIDDIQQTLDACEFTLKRLFHAHIPSLEERLAAVERTFELCEGARAAAFTSAVKTHRDMLHEQIAVVQSLSTPILPLYQGILVLPLIGSVDTARAEQLLERMLAGIAAHRAAAVIIDVTGVPSIDSDVATHLVRAAQAARLLGAQSIIAGIGADVARTMAALGVDFTGVTTSRNLEAALQLALAR